MNSSKFDKKESIYSEKPTGELVLQTLAMPASANPNGDIFGGWVISQMDLGASILAKKIAQSRTTTVALDAMSFKKPVNVGDVVSCYAQLIKVGRTSMQIQIEIWVTPMASTLQEKVTSGLFTFVAIDSQGQPWPVDPSKRV
jgi:acyl-CoA thioesterase YciA